MCFPGINYIERSFTFFCCVLLSKVSCKAMQDYASSQLPSLSSLSSRKRARQQDADSALLRKTGTEEEMRSLDEELSHRF